MIELTQDQATTISKSLKTYMQILRGMVIALQQKQEKVLVSIPTDILTVELIELKLAELHMIQRELNPTKETSQS